jgi:hypothetical protein
MDKLIIAMRLTASWWKEIEFTVGPSNKTIYAGPAVGSQSNEECPV